MQDIQRVSEMAEDDTPHHTGLRAERAGEQLQESMKATLQPEYGRKLEELVEIRHRNEQAEQRRLELEQERDKERRRVQQEERNRLQREETWEQFMQKEISELELRKEGQLARLLGEPRPGEPAEALRRLADEDKRQAQQGLVALMSGGELRYKPLDELSPDDMPARLAAERLRTTWLKKRQDGWLAQGEGSL